MSQRLWQSGWERKHRMDKKAEFVMFVGIGAMTRDMERGTRLAGVAMEMAGFVRPEGIPVNKSAFELSLEYLDRFYGHKGKRRASHKLGRRAQ
jgi:hypothetical protein